MSVSSVPWPATFVGLVGKAVCVCVSVPWLAIFVGLGACQCTSILTTAARFLDHTLQPLARVYTDYLHNSTSLSSLLDDLHVPKDTVLVCIDVESLYPSIPQTQCLQIIYDEMFSHGNLLLFDPNLIIQLLQTCINYDYFESALSCFQQIQGTAMEAAFSPTLANIFSVVTREFLKSQTLRPLALKRYIDDNYINVVVPRRSVINHFPKSTLVSSQPALQIHLLSSRDRFSRPNSYCVQSIKFWMSTETRHQNISKSNNLYQYLHLLTQNKLIKVSLSTKVYDMPEPTLPRKGLRPVLVHLKWGKWKGAIYLLKFIKKATKAVSYNKRPVSTKHKINAPRLKPPLFKCLLTPHFSALRIIILHRYKSLLLPSPKFSSLKHSTLHKELIRAQVTPSPDQLLDISVSFPKTFPHSFAGFLPMKIYLHNSQTL